MSTIAKATLDRRSTGEFLESAISLYLTLLTVAM